MAEPMSPRQTMRAYLRGLGLNPDDIDYNVSVGRADLLRCLALAEDHDDDPSPAALAALTRIRTALGLPSDDDSGQIDGNSAPKAD